MGTGSRRTTGIKRSKATSEITQLSAMVQELRQEFGLQKQELEQKIVHLEGELAKAKNAAPAKSEPETSNATSRRRMLRRLGVAAAGLATVGVASALSQEQIAEASTPMQIGAQSENANNIPVNNVVYAPTVVKTPSAPAVAGLPANGGYNTLTIRNDFGPLTPGPAGGSFAYPNDALVAISANGVAVNAQSTSGQAAVLGVQGDSTAVQGLAQQVAPGNQSAGVLGATDNANGVNGFSINKYGVYGFGLYGVVAQGSAVSNGVAGSGGPLLIQPDPQSGPPPSGSHAKGELHVDSTGSVYICSIGGASAPVPPSLISARHPNASAEDKARMAAGAAPQWAVLGGIAPSPIINFLSSPYRVLGKPTTANDPTIPANAIPQTTPASFQIEGGPIPSNATAILATVIVYTTSASGFVGFYPADAAAPLPIISSLSYFGGAPGAPVFTGATIAVKLGVNASTGKKGIKALSFTAVNFSMDIVAYWT